MPFFKIVNTDNFGGDYPNESALSATYCNGHTYPMQFQREERAQAVADALNADLGGTEAYPASRFYQVLPVDYVLQPGFEP